MKTNTTKATIVTKRNLYIASILTLTKESSGNKYSDNYSNNNPEKICKES